jgi:hypothetical protein
MPVEVTLLAAAAPIAGDHVTAADDQFDEAVGEEAVRDGPEEGFQKIFGEMVVKVVEREEGDGVTRRASVTSVTSIEERREKKNEVDEMTESVVDDLACPREGTEKRVIEIEEVIDEARVRELAEELAREAVEQERARHREEVAALAREVVVERELFTDRIDQLEAEVEGWRADTETERLRSRLEEMAGHLAGAREEVKLLAGLEGGQGRAGRRVVELERELEDQREVNSQLKAYVGEVLVNIMLKNPQILERKA